MKKRIGSDALVLIALLVILSVVSLQVANRNTSGDDSAFPRRSTTSTRTGGWKAAYLLLKRSGVRTGRYEKPPKTWPDSASIIVSGQESFGGGDTYWNEDQADNAFEWVQRGGTLIVLNSEDNALMRGLDISPEAGKIKDADVHPTQPVPYLSRVNTVFVPGYTRFLSLGKDATVLLRDGKPAVVAIKRGAGRIIAISEPGIIDNAHLTSSDNARFFLQTILAFNDPKRTDGVLFDEFHQGYQEEHSFWNALGQPGQFAVLQLVVLIALGCWSAAVRFGLPRSLVPQSRLSSEYVASLADLYRRARASDAALEGVYLSFWRDLCRAVGVPLDAETAEVARRAASSLGSDAYSANASQKRAKREEKLLNLMRVCETKIDAGAKNLAESELLSLARAIEDMRKELQLGRDERRD